MNQRIDQPDNQIDEVLGAKAYSIALPDVVKSAFDMAAQFAEEEFFLFGSTARKCILGDENPEFNDFDFLGNFDSQKVIEYFGNDVIKVYDHFRTVKVRWNGYAVDFIARPDAVTALRNSDISLSLVCIGKDGMLYDPMDYLPDFRARHVKIHNARDRGIEIPSLDNWPGTLSKDVFTGSSEETERFNRKDRDLKENEIEMAQYVLDKITDPDRRVISSYGIAVALPTGESTSDVVKFDGTASDELVITDVGWNYDWFYIPNNLGKTLSSLTKREYVEFTGTYLWPVTEKIMQFLQQIK